MIETIHQTDTCMVIVKGNEKNYLIQCWTPCYKQLFICLLTAHNEINGNSFLFAFLQYLHTFLQAPPEAQSQIIFSYVLKSHSKCSLLSSVGTMLSETINVSQTVWVGWQSIFFSLFLLFSARTKMCVSQVDESFTWAVKTTYCSKTRISAFSISLHTKLYGSSVMASYSPWQLWRHSQYQTSSYLELCPFFFPQRKHIFLIKSLL